MKDKKDSCCTCVKSPVPNTKDFDDKVKAKMKEGYRYQQAVQLVLEPSSDKKK